MPAQNAKRNQLMGALDDYELVKAAVVVDNAGAIKARVGSARALKAGGGTDQMVSTAAAAEGLPRENVYMAGVGADFLLVIFDDGVDFDSIKSDVDGLLAELEL
ncbi:MAG: hypothetical protein ACLFVJ_09090 [Persicimonas sp.]